MSDALSDADIAALRDGLVPGPTPAGPWEFGSYGGGEIRIGAAGDSKHGQFATMAGQWTVPWDSTDESREAFSLAAYIAACHPERIARLLAEIERLRALTAPAVPAGWTDDQMVRFGSYIISPSISALSYAERLELFREHEAKRGFAAPQPAHPAQGEVMP